MSQQPNMEELLCDYLDGTLDAKRRKAVEVLLQRDAKLRQALAAMQQVRGVLRDLPVETMPAAAAGALQQELLPPQHPAIPLYSTRWLIRLAAAVAIAITGGLVIWSTLPSPIDERTVAMDVVRPMAVPAEAMAMKKDSDLARLTEAEAMQPVAGMKGGGGGAASTLATEPSSENEATLMVVVADDIGGTQREIRNLLALNNISYESVRPSLEVRDERAKEAQPTLMGKTGVAATAAPPAPGMGAPAPAAPLPAPMANRPPMAKAEEKVMAPAAEAPAAPGAPARVDAAKPAPVAGPSRDAEQAAARGMQQVGGPIQGRVQAAGAQGPPAVYGVMVARNVTSDQLGKLRSGLRDASRSRNLRVVDASADRLNQAAFGEGQALNRAANADPYRQQAQLQSQTQVAAREMDQRQQDQVAETQAQRRVSYSARYDVTIVVQGEAAADAASTVANMPTWPLPATRPGSTLPSTSPVRR